LNINIVNWSVIRRRQVVALIKWKIGEINLCTRKMNTTVHAPCVERFFLIKTMFAFFSKLFDANLSENNIAVTEEEASFNEKIAAINSPAREKKPATSSAADDRLDDLDSVKCDLFGAKSTSNRTDDDVIAKSSLTDFEDIELLGNERTN
jgi:hypothetical protein